ncbi:MAG: 4Fe-4S dicluster domain-containing protein [Anaerolineae bacterium]|nr:4Fe-4S dicluster domain-containing protein [Anaerolineae bacterium]
MEISRRRFLGLVAAGAAAVVGAPLLKGVLPVTASEHPKARYALIIDTTKCTGCGACIEACRFRNKLPEGLSYIRRIVKGDNRKPWFLMIQCQHCAKPPCATVCPSNATYRREDGVVLIDERLCVGCKYCMQACPYQARVYEEERGVADKCWLCLPWVLGGGLPACVESCIPGARLFGRADDPESEVAQLIASGQAKPLHPEFGTDPSILFYIIAEE